MTLDLPYHNTTKKIYLPVIASGAPSQTNGHCNSHPPAELPDEIYTYLALFNSFESILACRQLKEEGTSIL